VEYFQLAFEYGSTYVLSVPSATIGQKDRQSFRNIASFKIFMDGHIEREITDFHDAF